MTTRRGIENGIAALVLLGAAIVLPASAQEWPARNVTVIVPLGAGSASDIMARVVSDQLSRQLNRTFVVENRPGAGGTIGSGAVAKSTPDGHTVLAYGALATANALYAKLPFNVLNDFVPVIPFGIQPLVIVASPTKYKTLADLIAAAKAKPGSLNYSSAGVGTASHFAGERLRVSAGIQAQHIPLKGAAEAVTEIVAGRIDFSPQLPTTTLSMIASGKIVALAVSAQKRIKTMPNVPTVLEAGLKVDAIYPFYSGLFLPAKTPRAIVEKFHQEAAKAIQAPEVQARFAKLGVEPMIMTLEQFAKFYREDVAAALALVEAAKIKRQ
jgi:tripartite-type tricarboxylate transporter receptor subunit TctC